MSDQSLWLQIVFKVYYYYWIRPYLVKFVIIVTLIINFEAKIDFRY